MNATRLRECLNIIGWSQRYLATRLKTHATTVQRWARGQQTIPHTVSEWLEDLARYHENASFPQNWNPSSKETNQSLKDI